MQKIRNNSLFILYLILTVAVISSLASFATAKNETSAEKNTKSQTGQINAEEHRSTVSNFVQNLLQIADREGGIGEQVRVIAQQQNESNATTTKAIEKVQSRNKIKTFLKKYTSSDYPKIIYSRTTS